MLPSVSNKLLVALSTDNKNKNSDQSFIHTLLVELRVEVMGRYSKHPKPVITTPVPASPIAHQRPTRRPPHRLDRKVSPELAAQLVAEYESGVPSTHLTMI